MYLKYISFFSHFRYSRAERAPDVCLRRHLHKGKFEFTYVSPSTVIVKRLARRFP